MKYDKEKLREISEVFSSVDPSDLKELQYNIAAVKSAADEDKHAASHGVLPVVPFNVLISEGA
jgi:hypothetical protein